MFQFLFTFFFLSLNLIHVHSNSENTLDFMRRAYILVTHTRVYEFFFPFDFLPPAQRNTAATGIDWTGIDFVLYVMARTVLDCLLQFKFIYVSSDRRRTNIWKAKYRTSATAKRQITHAVAWNGFTSWSRYSYDIHNEMCASHMNTTYEHYLESFDSLINRE